MDMKVSLESLYLKHFERVGISIIYEKVNKYYHFRVKKWMRYIQSPAAGGVIQTHSG
jgi:hypothetical protein